MRNKSIERVRYPENLHLKVEIVKARRNIGEVADAIGISRELLSRTVNGHYKGINVVPILKKELGIK